MKTAEKQRTGVDHDALMKYWMTINDLELNKCFAELDSTENLNNNPLAVRCAGHKAARLAFILGAKYTAATAQELLGALQIVDEKLSNSHTYSDVQELVQDAISKART